MKQNGTSESGILRKQDPLSKQQEIDPDGGLSPMDPPDAYSPPKQSSLRYDEMHPFLQKLWDEHDKITEELDGFEKTLLAIQEQGLSKEGHQIIRNFFHNFDDLFLPHHRKEEKLLFPVLEKRLLDIGEHSRGGEPTTAVDMMEDEHLKATQLVATVFNLFSLSVRLPDANSRLVVLDTALQQGKALVELLRLHIFRENTIVFPLAQNNIEKIELDIMEAK